MSPRLNVALNLAYEAGRSTLGLFGASPRVNYKADRSPVTEADLQAEMLIRQGLCRVYPEDGILGEEEGESGNIERRWVLDPIDGTKSFICGVPLYGTLLSYEEAGVPALGVCYFPALDQMYYAERGGGAFLNGRAIHVSSRTQLSEATLSCGSHASMEKFGRSAAFQALARQSFCTRTWSDAYGHALVASGRIEAMVDPVLNRWDISAMQIIVEEAGGSFTDFRGAENPQTEAISSNRVLHPLLLNAFAA